MLLSHSPTCIKKGGQTRVLRYTSHQLADETSHSRWTFLTLSSSIRLISSLSFFTTPWLNNKLFYSIKLGHHHILKHLTPLVNSSLKQFLHHLLWIFLLISCSKIFYKVLAIGGRRKSKLTDSVFSKMFATTSRLYLSSVPLSSHSMHQDAWNVHLSAIINKPIGFVSSRHRVVACRSFILPGQGNEIPIIKAISVSLTRFCNALHGRPLLLQLVPAVGFISFAVWGLQPIMRFVRNLFLHQKNDNGWKRSSAYHIMISYLQPLLIWSGTILFYRVFDPMVLPTEASQVVKQRILNFARSSSTVLAFAYCLSRLIQQAHNFFTEQNDSDDTRNMGFNFAGKALYTGVWVAAISLFMELLGFSTQKWVTAGGLGTVLLTLAGREIFTNFLSSVMIHATRPFVVNEWIQTKIEGYEVSGTVEHVGWWSPTIIRGDDREAVHIPNHKFTVNVVRNLSQKTHWRIKTNFAISHLDVSKINNIVADMRKVLAKSPQVEQQKLHRRVFLENINPDNQALVILVSCFVKTSHFEEYLCVKEAILLDLLRIINHHGARLATPIRTIQKIYENAGVDSVPYAETIFTHAGSTTTRPLLLIEPSLKVNTDRKTTDPPPSADEEQEPKPMRSDGTKVTSDLSPDSPPQTGSDVKHAKKTSSDSSKSKVDSPLASSTQHGNLDSSGLDPKGTTSLESEESLVPITENGSGGTGVALKPDTDSSQVSSLPVTRAPLEENLVLGVALDGSKRVLPIEEDMNPNTVDAKKLAASRNAGGVAPSAKDHKDGQVPLTVDQER